MAGIALIPGTLPIILAGPLAGRLFDRVGGRIPLVAGFLILAASGAALALGAGEASAVALIPGLLLQGLGLGIVLTVNDPTGLTAVPDDDAGEAAGMINTAEQMGGALGIAILTALELGYYFNQLNDTFDKTGFHPSEQQYDKVRDFIVEAEQRGLNNVPEDSKIVRLAHDYLISVPHRRVPGHLRRQRRDRGARRDRLLRARAAHAPASPRARSSAAARAGSTPTPAERPAITKHPPPPDRP